MSSFMEYGSKKQKRKREGEEDGERDREGEKEDKRKTEDSQILYFSHPRSCNTHRHHIGRCIGTLQKFPSSSESIGTHKI